MCEYTIVIDFKNLLATGLILYAHVALHKASPQVIHVESRDERRRPYLRLGDRTRLMMPIVWTHPWVQLRQIDIGGICKLWYLCEPQGLIVLVTLTWAAVVIQFYHNILEMVGV